MPANSDETIGYSTINGTSKKMSLFMKFWKNDIVWWLRNMFMTILFVTGSILAIIAFIVVFANPRAKFVRVTGDSITRGSAFSDSVLISSNIVPSVNSSAPNMDVSKGKVFGFYNDYLFRKSLGKKIVQPGEISPKITADWIRNGTGYNNMDTDKMTVYTLKNGAWNTCYRCTPDGFSVDTFNADMINANTINSANINTGALVSNTIVATNSLNVYTANVVGSAIIGNTLTVGNAMTVGGALSTSGTLYVAGSAQISGMLTGTSVLISSLRIYGAAVVDTVVTAETLLIYRDAQINGNIQVGGSVTSNVLNVNTISVVGNVNVNQKISVSGVNLASYGGSVLSISDGSVAMSYTGQTHMFTSFQGNAWPATPTPNLNMMMWYGGMAFQNAVAYNFVSTPSDYRLKRNIVSLNETINESLLLRIDIKTYQLNIGSDTTTTQIGIIAQQAISVVPEIQGINISLQNGTETIERLTIRSERLFYMGVAQVKYLTKRVAFLEQQNADIIFRLIALEKRSP